MKQVIFKESEQLFYKDCSPNVYYVAIKSGSVYELMHWDKYYYWKSIERLGAFFSSYITFHEVKEDMFNFDIVYQFDNHIEKITWLYNYYQIKDKEKDK